MENRKSRAGRIGIVAGMAAVLAVGTVASATAAPKPSPKPTAKATAPASKLPAVITIASVQDVTGPIAAYGNAGAAGVNAAVAQINREKFLGPNTKLKVQFADSAYSATKAAEAVTKFAADQSIIAIVGPQVSTEALATSPIATAAKVPIIYTQSSIDGVLTSKYTFRASPSLQDYYKVLPAYVAKQGCKNISVVYPSNQPGYAAASTGVLPDEAKKNGINILSSTAVLITTMDFQTVMSKVAKENPCGVMVNLTAPQMSTAVTQLRQAGYKGQIYSFSGAGLGALKGAGQDGVGVMWANDYAPGLNTKEAQAFEKIYAEATKTYPNNFAAETYDAVWWLARGLKAQNCATRECASNGLIAVGKTGFNGAQGKLTFKNANDAVNDGFLVKWDGQTEVMVK